MYRPVPKKDEEDSYKKQVRNTVWTFVVACALIRFVPIIYRGCISK